MTILWILLGLAALVLVIGFLCFLKAFYAPRGRKKDPEAIEIPEGEIYEVSGSDLLARAFCHEIDHLDGKLFVDNLVEELVEE